MKCFEKYTNIIRYYRSSPKHIYMKKTFLAFAMSLFLAAAARVQAQTYYTNSYGIWSYTTTNGTVTITEFQGSGNVYTASNGVVTIPSSINGLPVTAIGQSAFEGDYSTMLSVTTPNSITTIGDSAFAGCTYLTNILIGNSVINIGNYAFQGDNSLKGAYFLGNAPSYATNNLFYGDNNLTAYYLPSTVGWSNTFAGCPAVPWNPPLPALGISTYSNQPVLFFQLPGSFPTSIGTNYVLQMTTNLVSSNWVTITNGVSLIGLQITNVPSPSYFRLRPL